MQFTGVNIRSRYGVSAIVVGKVGISIIRFSSRNDLEQTVTKYLHSLKEWSYEIHSVEFTNTRWKSRSYTTITIVHGIHVSPTILNMVNAMTALNLIEKKAEGIWSAMVDMNRFRTETSDAEKAKEEEYEAYIQSFYEDDGEDEREWTEEDERLAQCHKAMHELGITPPDIPLEW